MQQQLRDKAKELLQSGAVHCVIGYERATDGISARPFFAYDAEETDRLIFDSTCVHNLVKYLLNKRDKPTAVVVKPCDSRAINLFITENQIERGKVFILGVVCPGMVQVKWNHPSEEIQPHCQLCSQHTPVVYDFLAGEPKEEKEVHSDTYSDVAEIEKKTAIEKAAFWEEHFNRCVRCYACRQVCPGCYCIECFVERLDPLWVGIRVAPPENHMWHTIRAFHLAGRCISCGECERVCVVNIPLMLLNRKLEKEVQELFHFQSGMDGETPAPLRTFQRDDKVGIGE